MGKRPISLRLLPLSIVTASTVLLTPLLYAQGPEVYELHDLPRAVDLEQFKQALLARPEPADPASLYSEVRQLEQTQQRLIEIRDKHSEVDSAKENLAALTRSVLNNLADTKEYCKDASKAQDAVDWWTTDTFEKYKSVAAYAAAYVGAPEVALLNSVPEAKPNESCRAYAIKLPAVSKQLTQVVSEQLSAFQKIEQERRSGINVVLDTYSKRKDRLVKALETMRQRLQENTAISLARDLWLVILVLGGIAIAILLIVKLFPERSQIELVQSGQVIQFITVLLLLTVIMALGLSGIIKETTLGTLLGGLAGYVLSQGVGRAAEHSAKKGKDTGGQT